MRPASRGSSRGRRQMEMIGKQKIWSFFGDQVKSHIVENTAVRKGRGHRVRSFLELATKVAELQFLNRDHVLLFRGQGEDYRNNQRNSTLKPTLFRPERVGNPGPAVLIERF